MVSSEPDWMWKLLVVPEWSKSWMMAESSREKISRSDSQDLRPAWEMNQCVVCSTSAACRLLWYGLLFLQKGENV